VTVSCCASRCIGQAPQDDDKTNVRPLQKSGCAPKMLGERVSRHSRRTYTLLVLLQNAILRVLTGVGTTLPAAHFVPGQFVDVIANS
jgi:hypothetical protein